MEGYSQNLIQLHAEEREAHIYRVFSIRRLIELFAIRKNTLVRPKLWDDPFENFILKSLYEIESGESVRIGFKDQLYGQCWSLVRDSDALWRIYSPDKNGVRVRSKIRVLFESLWNTCVSSMRTPSCFIGKVEYLPQKKILEILDRSGLVTGALLDNTGRGQVSTLLMKRREFSHEKEVRLVYFNHDDAYTLDIFQYDVDPGALFDEITFDPRLSDELFEVYKTHFERLGFPGSINRSPLYRVPEFKGKLRTQL